MKKMIKGMIIFFTVVIAGLVSILIYMLINGDIGSFSIGIKQNWLLDTKTISMVGTTEVALEGNSSDLIIKSSDNNEMMIQEYSANRKDKAFVNINESKGVVKIGEEKSTALSKFIGSNRRYIEVYLPESYAAKMNINSGSGDIYLETDLNCAELTINSESGYITVQNIAAEQISINSDSGDVRADTISGAAEIKTENGYIKVKEMQNNAVIEANSGDVTINKMHGVLIARTGSGYVTAKNIVGSAVVQTDSGDVNLAFLKLTGSLDIVTTSGYVKCALPKDAQFTFTGETHSGEISTFFEGELNYDKSGNNAQGMIGDSNENKITVSTASGDIRFINN